jgi:hypothetical protein
MILRGDPPYYYLGRSFRRLFSHLASPFIWSLAMYVAPSILSRLLLVFGSNTFSPSSVPKYALIPREDVLLHQFSRM